MLRLPVLSILGTALSVLAQMATATTVSAQSLAVSGPSTVNQNGGTGQYRAVLTSAGGSTTDVTSQATWQILETNVASVSAGKVTSSKYAGQFTLRASYGNFIGKTAATMRVTVPAATYVNVNSSMTNAQINSAVSNAAVGSEVVFAAGTYNLGTSPCCGIILKNGLTYTGPTSGSAAILSGTGGYYLMTASGTGGVVQNFTMQGGGFYVSYGAISNWNVEYNTFSNIDNAHNGVSYQNQNSTFAIFFTSSASNSDFSYNNFSNIGASYNASYNDSVNPGGGMLGYGLDSTTIEYNSFSSFSEGIHILYDNGNGSGVKILYNTFTGGHRIAIEQQDGQASGVEIAYNIISSAYHPWALVYGISAATSGSTGVNVHDNTTNANAATDSSCSGSGCHYGYGIEAWGQPIIVSHNLVEGSWLDGIGLGQTSGAQITNNSICGPVMANNHTYIVNENNTGQTQTNTTLSGNVTSSAGTCSFQ